MADGSCRLVAPFRARAALRMPLSGVLLPQRSFGPRHFARRLAPAGRPVVHSGAVQSFYLFGDAMLATLLLSLTYMPAIVLTSKVLTHRAHYSTPHVTPMLRSPSLAFLCRALCRPPPNQERLTRASIDAAGLLN